MQRISVAAGEAVAAVAAAASAAAAAADASPPRSTSPAPSSSLEEEARTFEFIIRIAGDPFSTKRLPDGFADFVDGEEPVVLQLHEEGCLVCRWPVDMWVDGHGKMYLHAGWEKFAHDHKIQPGFVLVFTYEGYAELSVKVFDGTVRHRYYHGKDAGEDEDEH